MKARKWYSGIWFLVVGIVIGLYAAWGISYLRGLHKDAESDPDTGEMNVMETKVDYPFHDSMEGWSLVLCEMGEGSMHSGREFRMSCTDILLLIVYILESSLPYVSPLGLG